MRDELKTLALLKIISEGNSQGLLYICFFVASVIILVYKLKPSVCRTVEKCTQANL